MPSIPAIAPCAECGAWCEIQHVIDQLTDDERRQYLSESFFLNFVSYENERLGAYMKKLPKKP